MDFDALSKGVVANAKSYGKQFGVKIDKDFAVLKFFEEAGEMAQAILVHQKKSRPKKFLSKNKSKEKLGEEMADVMGLLIVCADLFGVDLTKALQKKWLKKFKKHS